MRYAVLLFVVTGWLVPPLCAQSPITFPVNENEHGWVTGHCANPSLSADGRYVVFSSDADNLVAGDANRMRDVFLHDRHTDVTTRISVDSLGRGGNADSGRSRVALSADGRYVAYDSEASNLVTGDLNAARDVFVHDRTTGRTQLVSRGQYHQGDAASYLPTLSADGRFVAFGSLATNLVAGDTNGVSDVFVYDLAKETIERVSLSSRGEQGDRSSGVNAIALNDDGMVVAFESGARNLVPDYIGTFGFSPRVHVFDRRTRQIAGRTAYAGFRDAKTSGTYGIALSGTGQVTAFTAWGRYDTQTQTDSRHLLVHDPNPAPASDPVGGQLEVLAPTETYTARLSQDGDLAVFCMGPLKLVHLFDRHTGVLTTVSTNSQGVPASGVCSTPSLSPEGRHVAFESWAKDLVPNDTNNAVDVFVKDRVTGVTRRVSLDSGGGEAQGPSNYPSLSEQGQHVAFQSFAANLVPNDTNGRYDIFVRDLTTGQVTRVSVSSAGSQSNSDSLRPRVSADGRFIVFYSSADNLVPGDNNGSGDVFLHDRLTRTTRIVSVNSTGQQANASSGWPDISADGRWITFESAATNLVAGDTNSQDDVFLHDAIQGITTRVSVNQQGGQLFWRSAYPTISPSGRWIAFSSESNQIVRDDRNYVSDVFLYDRETGAIRRVSVDSAGREGTASSGFCLFSPVSDRGSVAFDTRAQNLNGGVSHALVVRDVYPRISATTLPRLGTRVDLHLEAPHDGGRVNQAAMSFGDRPGIRVGRRVLPLNLDLLFLLSLSIPAVWVDFSGQLDATGAARPSFWLPDDPTLAGWNMFAAFVVLDPTAPEGIRALSNAVHLQATL